MTANDTQTPADVLPRVLRELRDGTIRPLSEVRRERRDELRANGIPEHDLPPLVDDHGRLL